MTRNEPPALVDVPVDSRAGVARTDPKLQMWSELDPLAFEGPLVIPSVLQPILLRDIDSEVQTQILECASGNLLAAGLERSDPLPRQATAARSGSSQVGDSRCPSPHPALPPGRPDAQQNHVRSRAPRASWSEAFRSGGLELEVDQHVARCTTDLTAELDDVGPRSLEFPTRRSLSAWSSEIRSSACSACPRASIHSSSDVSDSSVASSSLVRRVRISARRWRSIAASISCCRGGAASRNVASRWTFAKSVWTKSRPSPCESSITCGSQRGCSRAFDSGPKPGHSSTCTAPRKTERSLPKASVSS